MKLLRRLEKSRDFWYLVIASICFFCLRFPSLFEPNWYGDEGIYQTIGMAMNRGRILYSQIWDNKPPLLYVFYALLHSDQFFIRLASIFFGLLSIIVLYQLCLLLFRQRYISIFVTSFFGFIFAIPLLEGNIANAENFLLLFTLTAGFLIYRKKVSNQNSKFIILGAGLVLGFAFLLKVVAFFDLLAFSLFWFFVENQINYSFVRKFLNRIIVFFSGFFFPLIITCFYFLFHHAFFDFVQSAFFDNVGYVAYGNSFLIPQGFLILKILLLTLYVFILWLYRRRLDRPALFVLLWLGFSVFSAFFSQRPYTHYLLVTLPSFSLGLGLILYHQSFRLKTIVFLLLFILSIVLVRSFTNYGFPKTFTYYSNFISYITGAESLDVYRSFFDPISPRDYSVASFLKAHTIPYENVFLWGNSAQIYTLSKTLPINRFTVAYHITQSSRTVQQTALDLLRTHPRYVIILAGTPPIPFTLESYNQVFSFQGASIYERSN